MKINLIIAAGGKSTRAGQDKLNAKNLKGKTVLECAIAPFLCIPQISKIIIGAKALDLNLTDTAHITEIVFSKPRDSRPETVYNAMSYIEPDCEILLIHDGARPYVTVNLIERVISNAKKYGSAIPALAITDTIKQVSGESSETVDRASYMRVSTPQGFKKDGIVSAYKKALAQGGLSSFTDCSSIYDLFGTPSQLIKGEESNTKITTAEHVIAFMEKPLTIDNSSLTTDNSSLTIDNNSLTTDNSSLTIDNRQLTNCGKDFYLNNDDNSHCEERKRRGNLCPPLFEDGALENGMQNAECRMQNCGEKNEMQNAECRMQNCGEKNEMQNAECRMQNCGKENDLDKVRNLSVVNCQLSVDRGQGSENAECRMQNPELPAKKTSDIKIGIGYDIHRLIKGRPLILGGVEIPHNKGLLGHSDADVLTHAIIDALLSAASLQDIGYHFPDSSSEFKDANSLTLLQHTLDLIKDKGRIANISCIIIAEKPKLTTYRDKIKASLSNALKIPTHNVSLSFKTNEGCGDIGKEQAIACHVSCILK